MEEVILDTSVVVKWFAEEKDSKSALYLRDKHKTGQIRINAPEIITLELTNALFFGAGFRSEVLKEAICLFLNFHLNLIPVDESLIDKARGWMEKHNIAIYDAIFIALSETTKIPLITADKKHHKKAYSKMIRYLEEM